jgi:hypothetical protein
MSRLKGAVINVGQGLSYAAGRENHMAQLDLSMGGQFGYQMDAGAYVSNAGYRPQQIIPILIEAPRGFNYLPNPEKSVAVLKALIENQSKTITGLRTGLNVEFAERAIGGAGHMQRDPTKVSEEISNPNHTWDERYGRAIHNFWKWYIRNLIGDPQNMQPGLMTFGTNIPDDHLPDLYSFTTLYIQPDPLRRRVDEAWLITNMIPNTSSVLESQMDKTAGSDVPEISIEFGGIPVVSRGVQNFAQSILDRMNYVNAGPMQRPAFIDKIDADITSAERGYREDLAAAASIGVGL